MKNKKIGEILREYREAKGLLLREVASKMSMDQALLSKIERNERWATKEQILMFADLFGIKQDELLIAYLSDKIVSELEENNLALLILKAAEHKIKKNQKVTL
jgi:transcriptional regulator with XRE-family HTH domain